MVLREYTIISQGDSLLKVKMVASMFHTWHTFQKKEKKKNVFPNSIASSFHVGYGDERLNLK